MARRIIRIVALAFCLTVGYGSLTAANVQAQQGGTGSTNPELMQLNVKDVSVQQVLKLIAEAGKFNIAIGGGVKGKVTLYISDIAPRELLDIVIGVVDAAYIEEKGTVWVMDKTVYANRYGEPFADNLRSKTFVLKEANVKDVLPTLRDLLGKQIDVKSDASRNIIRVKASPRLLREAGQLVEMLDTPQVADSFQLTSIPVDLAKNYLENLMKGRATFVEDPINQRLLVSASKFDLERVGEVLQMLDVGDGLESALLNIKYAEPDSLAEQLRPHLTPELGRIYSDKMARKLVVVDYPVVVGRITDLVHEYDTPIRQVLLETKIIQITTSREIRSGIDWSVLQDQVNVQAFFPILTNTESGLRGDFGNLSSKNYQVIVDALETYGDTELLSSPRLVVVDGGTGLIHVGSQVPYKTIDTRESAAGVITQFEKVIVVDVGVKMEVEVRILGEDMIFLKVRPEVSSVTGESVGVPIIDASTVDSSLMVENGNTVILGGLIRNETRTVRKGIPILSRIPLVKYLFSSNVEEKYKSELIILLTPKIMSGRELYKHPEISDND